MSIDEGKSAEMQYWSGGFLSIVLDGGGEIVIGRTRAMGGPILGNLDCKK